VVSGPEQDGGWRAFLARQTSFLQLHPPNATPLRLGSAASTAIVTAAQMHRHAPASTSLAASLSPARPRGHPRIDASRRCLRAYVLACTEWLVARPDPIVVSRASTSRRVCHITRRGHHHFGHPAAHCRVHREDDTCGRSASSCWWLALSWLSSGQSAVALGDEVITADVARVGGPSRCAALMTICRGPAVRCPRCKLLIAPRVPTLSPRHCPRCLARGRIAVELEILPSRCSGEGPLPDGSTEP
jgi:hypothetical protein